MFLFRKIVLKALVNLLLAWGLGAGKVLLFFCSLLFFYPFLIILASLAFDLVTLLMQAEELALTFDVFFSEGAGPVELAASVNKEHFLRFLISYVSHDEVFDYL